MTWPGTVPPPHANPAPPNEREYQLQMDLENAKTENERLRALIDNPHTSEFLDAVRIEAAHQRERWGTEHDAGKAPADWLWLLGWLSGKAVHAAVKGEREKALHHTISSAAVLLNWHAYLSGERNDFRPGIDAPEGIGNAEIEEPRDAAEMACENPCGKFGGCAFAEEVHGGR